MSADPIKIYENQDFYAPSFEVSVANQPLRRDVIRDVTSVTYRDNIEEIDSFEITINNWDAEERTFKYSDGQMFDPGRTISLKMGYFGRDRNGQDLMRMMLTGEITSLRPSFPSGGQPTLVVSGLNVLHRLRKRQESQAYANMTDSQIARQIGGRLGITIHTDAAAQEKPYAYLIQDNQYDIIFLMQRARRIGYDLFVEEQSQNGAGQNTLFFGPSSNVRAATYQLTYGVSLIEFQPNFTTANQVGQVMVHGWDAVRKQPIEATANRSDLVTKGVGRRGGQDQIAATFNERQEIIVNRPVASQDEARILARETLERIAKDMVRGSGATLGLPDLRAGSVLSLIGLGARFSGRYFVTATTHTVGDGGYTTQFECRREELAEG